MWPLEYGLKCTKWKFIFLLLFGIRNCDVCSPVWVLWFILCSLFPWIWLYVHQGTQGDHQSLSLSKKQSKEYHHENIQVENRHLFAESGDLEPLLTTAHISHVPSGHDGTITHCPTTLLNPGQSVHSWVEGCARWSLVFYLYNTFSPISIVHCHN